MFGSKLVFWWCCALLFVASSSKHHRNFTKNNEERDISKAQYKIYKNSKKNYVDEKEINVSTIYKFNETDSNEDSNECFIPHKICARSLMSLIWQDVCNMACCHLDDHLTECIPGKIKAFYAFVEMQYSLQSKNQELNLTAIKFFYDPCQEIKQFYIKNDIDVNENLLIANGTVYFPYNVEFVESKSFCLMDVKGDMLRTGCNITTFNINFPTEIVQRILIYKLDSPDNPLNPIIHHHISINISLRIISTLFLLTIFLVYSILPKLRNKYGFILRNRIGAIIVFYIFYIASEIDLGSYFIESIMDSVCYFGFLAAYFWTTVMSFDMWWTFRSMSSLVVGDKNRKLQEEERKKKERKKLIRYSVYAWGISFILTIVCVIMDSVPSEMFRPEFSNIRFWFIKNMDRGLYRWIPSISTICIICNTYFSISTKLKIRRYKKQIAHGLRNDDSQVFDKIEKWFNLCQKWFIMMFIDVIGISAFIVIISLIFPYTSFIWYTKYILYSTEMAVNIGIFITFVCKKKIKKLLLMRFGYQNYNVLPRARQTEVITDSTAAQLGQE